MAIGLLAFTIPALAPAVASAFATLSASPSHPSPVAVGLSFTTSVTVANTSTAGESLTLCKSGDPLAACNGSRGIALTPSCAATTFDAVCTSADLTNFSAPATASGSNACGGRTFNVSVVDATFGTLTFAPVGGDITLTAGSICTVSVNLTVLKRPATDSDVGTPGRQTYMIAEAAAPKPGGGTAPSRNSDLITVTLAPATPNATDPPSPANSNMPFIQGTAPVGATTVTLYTNSSCTAVAGSGSAGAFTTTGIAVNVGVVSDNQSYTFYATTTDGDGGVSPCSSTFVAYDEDSTAPLLPVPNATIPASPANDNNPKIKGTAETGSTVRVYSDVTCATLVATGSQADFGSTGLSVTAPVADNSTTTYYAKATDVAGNTSGCSSAFVTYQEDSAPPAVLPTVTATSPSSPSNDNSPRVTGSAPGAATVTLYSNATCTTVVGTGTAAAFTSTGITVALPSNSATTLYATSADAAGNATACSAAGPTYVEDSNAPSSPTLTGTQPSSPANNNAPRIAGTAETGSTVRLYTDAGCAGPVAGTGTAATFASPGISASVNDNTSTVFYARTTDTAGNVSACSGPTTYVEDSSAPETSIDSGPAGSAATPTFQFSSNEPGSSFECRVDNGAYAVCVSPFTVPSLPPGTHTFEVRSLDSAGNFDGTSSTRQFTVPGAGVTPPPPPPPSVTPPPAVPPPPPAAATPRQAGCLGIKGAVYVGTAKNNLRNGKIGTDIMFGLAGSDTLRGAAGLDCLYGGAGADNLRGGSGADRLFGGTGNDRLDGLSGNDILRAQSGNDRLNGGTGNDNMTGGSGKDRLIDRRGRDRFSGGSGSDRIDARDSTARDRRVSDRILCGPGRDTVLADPKDRVTRDCEKVTRRSLRTVAAY